MQPKRDSEGFAIDYSSNTVEDAAKFQKYWNSHLIIDDSCFDEYSSDEEEEEYDDCGCSDPCCPCGGVKRGTP